MIFVGGSALVERGTTLNEADVEMNVGSQRFTWTLAAPQEPPRTHTSPRGPARIHPHTQEPAWSHTSHADSHGLTRTPATSHLKKTFICVHVFTCMLAKFSCLR